MNQVHFTPHTRGIIYGDARKLQFPFDAAQLRSHSAFRNLISNNVPLGTFRRFFASQLLFGQIGGLCERVQECARASEIDLRKHVEGKDFIDAGCGRSSVFSSIALARSLGARNYVGVDTCLPKDGNGFIRQLDASITSNIGILLIETDMMDFFRGVPANSQVVAMMNLITGREVVFQDNLTYETFPHAAAGELTRIVQKSGLAFGMSSDTLSALPSESWNSKKEGGINFAVRRQ